MMDFEQVLQECLEDMEQGGSDLDECLSRHPQHASELRPILLTSAYLERGRETRPAAAFKSRVRAKLTREMQAYPRKSRQFNFTFLRLASSFAVMVLAFLITVTAYAQRALPGDSFYRWKLVSENVWRAISPDPVGVDLAIAERRLDELIAVQDDPARYSQTLAAYLEVVARLRSAMDAENEARILIVLDSQMEELNRSGIPIPQPDPDLLPQLEEPLLAPTDVPLPTSELPVSTAAPLSTALPLPTDLPISTEESAPPPPPIDPNNPPEIVPPVQIPPLLP